MVGILGPQIVPSNAKVSDMSLLDHKIKQKYQTTGFISSGTYGRVYRAKGINGTIGDFAIKR